MNVTHCLGITFLLTNNHLYWSFQETAHKGGKEKEKGKSPVIEILTWILILSIFYIPNVRLHVLYIPVIRLHVLYIPNVRLHNLYISYPSLYDLYINITHQ